MARRYLRIASLLRMLVVRSEEMPIVFVDMLDRSALFGIPNGQNRFFTSDLHHRLKSLTFLAMVNINIHAHRDGLGVSWFQCLNIDYPW